MDAAEDTTMPHGDDAETLGRLPLGQDNDSGDGILLVPFSGEHCRASVLMTLREYPFPENLLTAFGVAAPSKIGIAAIDPANDDFVAGYFVGNVVPPFSSGAVGFSRKRVANLKQICTSSKYQKRGIAQRMGRFLLDGKHPNFNPDDYDEIFVQDTDVFNSPSWLFSDRVGCRYFPTHEIIRRLGFLGYVQLLLTFQHCLPGQFLKCLIKSDEEAERADDLERQRGAMACLLSGLVPCAYYVVHWHLRCGRQDRAIDLAFLGYVYGVVYLLLATRFALTLLLAPGSAPPSYREYDFWWIPAMIYFGPVLTVLMGFPLFGWAGGFYLGLPGINYRKDEYRRAIGLLYLPLVLISVALFLAHTLLRIFAPSFLGGSPGGAFVDVLGTTAFFFTVTDIAMGVTSAFPSGAVAIRRWNPFIYMGLLLSWVALLVITMKIPGETASAFLDLSIAACRV